MTIIIAVLAIIASNLNFNRKVNTQNRDRFSDALLNYIKTENLNALTGKGFYTGSGLLSYDHSVLTVSGTEVSSKYFKKD